MPDKKAKMSYEEALEELKQIVAKLNEGKVTLDESLQLYKRGNELAAYCDNKLREVTQKISEVNKANGGEDPLNIEESEV
jgi:exodeoxyribonuclease VII small subunit